LPSNTIIHPYLINNITTDKLIFNGFEITINHIIQIINQSFIEHFPFSIKIYTSYHYVNSKFIKTIQNNFIGFYENQQSKETAYIFLSPLLNQNQFCISFIPTAMHTTDKFCQKNIFNNAHVNEGTKLSDFKTNKDNNSKENLLLNQEFCICEHPSTIRLNSTRKNLNIKHLASTKDQKYYLLENLGKFL